MKNKMQRKWMTVLQRYVIIFFASTLYAAGLALLFEPNHIAPGGISGLSIVIKYLTHIPTGVLYLIFQIPIMVIAIWQFGFGLFFSTLFSILVSSAMMDIFSAHFQPATSDPMLASIAGGVVSAVSIGIIFRQGATTGGSDIIVKLLRKHFLHVPTGVIYRTLDFGVVALSALAYKNIEAGLYGAISVYLSSIFLDKVLYGGNVSVLAFIISTKQEEIRKRLLYELSIGATILEGEGAYKGQPVKILMCATKNTNGPRIKQIVKEEDDQAFMIVTSANSVFGEGFQDYYEKIL